MGEGIPGSGNSRCEGKDGKEPSSEVPCHVCVGAGSRGRRGWKGSLGWGLKGLERLSRAKFKLRPGHNGESLGFFN